VPQKWALNADAGPATFGQPTFAKPTTLVLGVTAPYPGLLIGLKGILQAGLGDLTAIAESLGDLDSVERGTSGTNWEEHLGVGLTAG